MWGVTSTGHSLVMSLELSAGDMGEITVGTRPNPEFAVGAVKICELRDEAPSTRLPSQLSVGAADGRAKLLFSPVSQKVRVGVGEFGRRAAAAAQVPFAGDAFVFPE